MTIPFTCPHCGMATEVADHFAGISGPCGTCGQIVTVPGAAAMVADDADPVGGAPRSAAPRRRPIAWLILGLAALPLFCVCGGIAQMLTQGQWEDAQESARARLCHHNLEAIGLALASYHADHGCYPPAYLADDQGRPQHSWRVLLLPHLNEKELYAEYHFDEHWDGPHNRQLAQRMPKVYGCPSDPDHARQFTSYLGSAGERAFFGTTSVSREPQIATHDGASGTLAAYEAADSGVCWLEPTDLPKQPRTSRHARGSHVLMADGSVHVIDYGEFDDAQWQALQTIDGGEPRVELP